MSETTTNATPIIPAMVDPARQDRAKAYARARRWLSLGDLALGVLIIAGSIGTGWHLRLRDALAHATFAQWQLAVGWHPGLVAAYGTIFIVALSVISAPLSVYGGFVLPGKYGLRKQGLAGWLIDQAKGFVLSLIFAVALLEGLYFLLATQPLTWWLYLSAALLFLTVILANLAPILIVPLFFKLTPMPEGDLRARLLAMAARAKTQVRGVFVMNMSRKTSAGNAAVMGLGNTRRIVVGDTIISEYTPDEVEVILAHELGHQVHADIWKGIAVQTVLTLGGLALVNVALHAIVAQPIFGLHGLADSATIPILAALLGIYGTVTGPVSNTYSRIVERQADQYALDMTRNPTSFISAFHRLANQNLAQLDPNPIVEALFYDHPAIGKRIRHAESWQTTHR